MNAAETAAAMKNLKALAIRPSTNTKANDVTGAFAPEADAFVKMFAPGSLVMPFDNTKGLPTRRAEVTRLLLAQPATKGVFDTLAFFCHGWASGIQAGFLNQHVDALATLIAGALGGDTVDHPTVVLYCCSTGTDVQDSKDEAAGKGDNSFADRLRDALCRAGMTHCRVMGHSTAAHTTQNPNARFFDGNGSAFGGTGGYSVVGPKTDIWKPWVKALQTTDLRFRFPYMAIEDIHAELAPKVA
jgi:hypothetical protein